MLNVKKSAKRLLALTLSTLCIASAATVMSTTSVFAADSVKIGHASSAHGHTEAGDQYGNEVKIANWYSHSWVAVFRPKSEAVAEKIAKAMEDGCKNDNIGYYMDTTQRKTLYNEAKKVNWDLSKIKTPCCTDCSAMVSVCVNAAGITVSESMTTSGERQILKDTGKFTIYTSSEYLTKSDNLKRGDILLYEAKSKNDVGHTVVVLSNGKNINVNPYYPRCTANVTTFTDGLKSVNVNSSFANRQLIAEANGIAKYMSSSADNNTLLKKLKSGKLKKATKSVSSEYFPKYYGTSGNLAVALKAIEVNNSLENRKKIAKYNGISNYTGVSAQDTKLVSLLKSGKLRKTSVTYFKKYTGSSTSIVAALNAIGVDSSYAYRQKIAAANGISNYSGTADQNTKMLNLLKQGKLKKPSGSTVKEPGTGTVDSTYFKKYTGSSTSIVAALNAIGVDSSYAYRQKIAAENGISNYSGTADQNTKMLNLLKKGKLKKPSGSTTVIPSVTYFKKYTGSSTSIVTALNAIGADSSYAYRQKIAAKNKISNYSGTADQNTKMLNLLKQGKLIKP